MGAQQRRVHLTTDGGRRAKARRLPFLLPAHCAFARGHACERSRMSASASAQHTEHTPTPTNAQPIPCIRPTLSHSAFVHHHTRTISDAHLKFRRNSRGKRNIPCIIGNTLFRGVRGVFGVFVFPVFFHFSTFFLRFFCVFCGKHNEKWKWYAQQKLVCEFSHTAFHRNFAFL